MSFKPETPIHKRRTFTLAELAHFVGLTTGGIHHWHRIGKIREFKRSSSKRYARYTIPRHEMIRLLEEAGRAVPGLWMPRKKLLLVDDNPAIRKQLVDEFTRRKVPLEIRTAATVAAGLAIAEKWKPDVIAVDYFFPEKRRGADQALAFIRKAKRIPGVKVIGISAWPDIGPKMLEAGAVEFLAKPIKHEAFKNLVFQLATSERRQAKRELRRPLEGAMADGVMAS